MSPIRRSIPAGIASLLWSSPERPGDRWAGLDCAEHPLPSPASQEATAVKPWGSTCALHRMEKKLRYCGAGVSGVSSCDVISGVQTPSTMPGWSRGVSRRSGSLSGTVSIRNATGTRQSLPGFNSCVIRWRKRRATIVIVSREAQGVAGRSDLLHTGTGRSGFD